MAPVRARHVLLEKLCAAAFLNAEFFISCLDGPETVATCSHVLGRAVVLGRLGMHILVVRGIPFR